MVTSRSELPRELLLLFDAACSARHHAYAPYSEFLVGAALRDERGRVHAGANVEYASYGCTTCAEEAALAAMVQSGGRLVQEALLVADGHQLVTPCGSCRQRLAEFGSSTTLVHSARPHGVETTRSLSELLPHAFDLRESRVRSY